MNPLLARSLPYLLGVLAILGAGWALHHKGYTAGYATSEAKGWQTQALAEQAARKATEDRLATLQTTLANNQKVSHALQDQNAALVADRARTHDLVQRLLVAAARSGTPRDPMPETGDRPAPPGTRGETGNESLGSLLTDAADECKRNANRLDALGAQIRPQL